MSNLTGEPVEEYTGDYWVRHVREAVRFDDGMRWLAGNGVTRCLEVGPAGVLSAMAAPELTYVPALRKDRDDTDSLLRAVAQLWTVGVPVDWTAILPAAPRVDLPTYAFQGRRFWPRLDRAVGADVEAAGLGRAEHPLLGATVSIAGGDGLLLTGRLSAQRQPWLADHVVLGRTVLPGTAFVELATSAGRQTGRPVLEELTIEAPLVLPADGVQLQVSVGADDGAGHVPVSIWSRPGPDARWLRHAVGSLVADSPDRTAPDRTTPDLSAWPPADATAVDLDGFYDQLADRAGLAYGPVFRGLRAAWRCADAVYAEVALPEDTRPEAAAYGVHPALLDAALHVIGLTDLAGAGATRLPFAWTDVRLLATGAGVLRVRLSATGSSGIAIDVADGTGAPVARIGRLAMRAVTADALERPTPVTDGSLYTVDWTAVPAPEGASAPFAAIGVDERAGAAVTYPGFADLPDGGELPDLVLWRIPEASRDGLVPAAHTLTTAALDAVRAWLADERFTDTRLAVLTSDAVPATGPVTDPAATAVWGLLRSAQSENPGRIVLVDTDDDDRSWSLLGAAVRADEPELALRAGTIRVPRLTTPPNRLDLPVDVQSWRVAPGGDGALSGLACVEVAGAELGAGEVRVAVRAVGVNFRDVLLGLGMYPDPDAVMGSEGAGVVVEVGADVSDLVVGDRVFGLFHGGFAPQVVADRRVVARMPAGWSFAQGAAVPMAFLTAWYGLADLGRLRAGERVLVHAAAGGVGSAAVQLARLWGAEVFATASPGKWAAVEALGVDPERIASSRDLGFADVFGGVDVVLDSLAGEFVDASLGMLRPGGRFVEMGKADVRDAAEVERRLGVWYKAFDLSEAGADRTAVMLADLVALFEAGDLRLLPPSVADVRELPAVLGTMSRGAHVGKNVVLVPRPVDGTVLITGGTGGLGAVVAAHLVDVHGVRDLVLVSRSGGPVPELDARVRVVAADVSDRVALAGVLDGIEDLAGVVHCAGVLDDGVFTSLTPERVAGVLAPKVDAVVHLHELTRDMDLAMFTVFSSISAVFGSAGQAAYAAANAFLDGFVAYRRGLGLVGQSLGWGLWANTAGMGGAVAARVGGGMSDELGLALFDAAHRLPDAHLVPARLDLDAVRASGAVPPLLRRLVTTAVRKADDGGVAGPGLAQRLTGLADADQERLLTDVVCTAAAGVLGHSSADAVVPSRAFKDLGFDSLTSVELRNRLNAATGLRLPATLVFDYPTPTVLAGHLRTELLGAPAPQQARVVQAATDDDAIAIVGMACRYPGGANNPEELWRLVTDGADAIGPFPTDRGWAAGTADYVRQGGFIDDATAFDSRLFGISPREALTMDPQQRVLLEACWEVFERAGFDPESLRGEPVGVFIGSSSSGYGTAGPLPDGAEAHALTGTAPSVISGRVAYTFGIEGPAVTVDTACSSSLVALHLAAQALRSGECTMALTGGVTVLAGADIFPSFDSQGGLAGDGRCKPFSADADGTGWSEGVGVLLVEKLSDARRHGHQVLAVVRGSAVNQDGASNGLTAPNGPSQQRVITQALANARLAPADIDVVEAHGTGTALGDPIEAQALLATYGRQRPADHPLQLGSIKSNIGHTQSAAGVAGIIKMVLAMRHGELPRTLHAQTPSAHIDWTSGALHLLTEPVAWPAGDRPRRAAVSSFGISGTNAHVVLEEAPTPVSAPAPAAPVTGPVPWVLSARTPEALRAQAERLREYVLARPELRPADVGSALVSTRAVLDRRAVVVGSDLASFAAALTDLDAGSGGTGRTAFLLTGQGAQRVGMGVGLAARFPVFAEVFDGIVARFDGLREALGSDEIHQTKHAQAGLFAVEVALFRLLESWGVTPDYLLGHSIGEIAAAHVAGVMSLDDAVTLVAARGRLMQALPAGGAMLAVQATEADVRTAIGRRKIDVAAVNGPTSVVVSGKAAALDKLAARFDKTARLTVSHAFHSSLMEPMLAEFAAAISHLDFAAPRIPVVSNLTGEPVEEFTADYWVRHVREAVRFHDGITWLAAHGVTRCLEVGPAAVLSAMAAPELTYVAALRKDRDEATTVLEAAGRLWTEGVPVDWTAILPAAPRVDLPTYAFQRDRYWLMPTEAAEPAGAEDGAFWSAVERGDHEGLAGQLDGVDARTLESMLPALSAWRRRRRSQGVVEGWRYRVGWAPMAEPAPAVLSGTWLVVSDTQADDVVSALVSAGAEVAFVPASGGAEVVRAAAVGDVRGVVWVGGEAWSLVSALQEVTAAGVTAPVWVVTRGAVAVGRSESVTDVAASTVWGVGRVAALELPRVWGGLVDVPVVLGERDGRRFAAVLAGGGEDQVAVRASGVYARRLRRAAAVGSVAPVSLSGTVLVTGGTGALGSRVARWVVSRGASRVVLVSRRGDRAPGAGDLAAELTGLGAEVSVVACDVADRNAVRAVVAGIEDLAGVVHAAGVSGMEGLLDVTEESFGAVVSGKVSGALHLHEATADLDLDLFVVFSSIAGVWGSGGQAAYAAGNAALDALVESRRAAGKPGTAVAWGPWADGGMAGEGNAADYLARRGLAAMDPDLAMQALDMAVDTGDVTTTVADVDWSRFVATFAAQRPAPLFGELAVVAASDNPADEALASRLAGLPQAERRRELLALVRAQTAKALGYAGAAQVEAGAAFRDLGIDSVTAVEVKTRINAATGLHLGSSLVFDYPTPQALADHLLHALGLAVADAPVATLPARVDGDDIVIVGMACRYPGGVESPEDLWRLVAGGA
ncbi:type I polyketide synthase, partial [Micromonospora sp. NPDC050980]|uniref:type I polyketide synthase n=1 Tax=Micromonospora sp. NPDC050980 TaxID=3155161 RepID=UPI0033DBC081